MVKFIDIIEREVIITIDGYSTAKTILGVMRDIEKEVAKIECVKSQSSFYSCVSNKEAKELIDTCTIENACGGFYVEIEEVGNASRLNEDTDEMEYSDANFYFCTCLVK